MPISIRLGESLEKRLANLATLIGRTKAYYLRIALEEKLEELEDIYIAEHRVEQAKGKRWSLSELENEDDLAG